MEFEPELANQRYDARRIALSERNVFVILSFLQKLLSGSCVGIVCILYVFDDQLGKTSTCYHAYMHVSYTCTVSPNSWLFRLCLVSSAKLRVTGRTDRTDVQ